MTYHEGRSRCGECGQFKHDPALCEYECDGCHARSRGDKGWVEVTGSEHYDEPTRHLCPDCQHRIGLEP